jgi:hypothetical protein
MVTLAVSIISLLLAITTLLFVRAGTRNSYITPTKKEYSKVGQGNFDCSKIDDRDLKNDTWV